LFDRTFQDERVFFVPGCAWHQSLPEGQTKPDNDVGQPPEYAEGLARGENHFAYVSGLDNGSLGHLPLIADGFSDSIGVYADDEDKKGGIWEGEAAIVVRVDGSGKMETLGRDLRVYDKRNYGKLVDIFSPEYFSGTAVKILNPR
jgi:hypothetical protein